MLCHRVFRLLRNRNSVTKMILKHIGNIKNRPIMLDPSVNIFVDEENLVTQK